ncbi:hypothetical protein [Halocola ammonii]
MKNFKSIQAHFQLTFLLVVLLGLALSGCKNSKQVSEITLDGERDIYFSQYKIHFFGDYELTDDVGRLYPPYDRSALGKITKGTKVLGMASTFIEPYFSTFILRSRSENWQTEEEIREALTERGANNIEIGRMKNLDELNNSTFTAAYELKSTKFDIILHVRELIITADPSIRILIWTYNNQLNLDSESQQIFSTLERVYEVQAK